MIRILHEPGHRSLFIGNQADEEAIPAKSRADWAIVHACKEPYHREALGYSGRSAPKDHPEYLMAYRPPKKQGDNTLPNRLILNLVDVEDPAYVSPKIVDAALEFIEANSHVLVHCNQGASRSSTIGLLYLSSRGLMPAIFEAAEAEYRKMYPPYCPGRGMRGFASANWERYLKFWSPM